MAVRTDDNQVVLFGESAPGRSRPYGIYVLASFLRRHGIKTQTVWGWNFISFYIFAELCHKFLNDGVKVVGISSTLLSNSHIKGPNDSYNFFGCSTQETIRRFELIRQLAPNAKIVVGGSQVLYGEVNNLPEASHIDLFIKGQGEQTLLELVKSPNGRIRTESLTPPLTSDAVYPFQHFETTSTTFDPSDCILPGESLAIEFARGCIFNCSFCSYEMRGKRPGTWNKSKQALREELIANYNNHGTTLYYSTDDLINDSEEKVLDILEVAQSLPFQLQYIGCVRLDLIRRYPNMAKNLIDSGMIGCFFGIETIDDVSGRRVGKGLGLDRINETIDICNRAWDGKMVGDASFIMGLPNHTPDTKYELMNWLSLSEVKNVIKNVSMHAMSITPRLGLSNIDKDPEKYGYQYHDTTQDTVANSRYGEDMNWKTDSYSFAQAKIDAIEVRNYFARSKKYSPIPSFYLPHWLSLSDKKAQMMEVLLTDQSETWLTAESWDAYLKTMKLGYRKHYIDAIRSL
jgi:radical SAM superfamily enzyme YgiQ (UPF0313 family)